MIEWIKCSDRLPDHWMNVLFTTKASPNGNEVNIGYYVKEEEIWRGKIISYHKINVYHWAEINLPKKLLTIHEAIDAFRKGKKIKRMGWIPEKNNISVTGEIHYMEIKDIMYDDWEIVNE